jgi:disulfide bond formation protein DsbB
MEPFLTNLFGIGSLLALVALVMAVASLFIKTGFTSKLLDYISKYSLVIVAVLSLGGIFGSLLYSNFVGFIPCELCWWQRVLLYPQSIIAIVALWKKDRRVLSTLLIMSILGLIVALYQVYLQHWPDPNSFCSVGTSDCSRIYVQFMGFLTMPAMSAILFLWAIFASAVGARRQTPVIE